MTELDLTNVQISTGELDVDLPTPIQVAQDLSYSFNQDQAENIAANVYQPLREAIKNLVLKGAK